MSIRIVTDSTCDLPASTVARYGISVVPLYINFGSQGYQDGIEISREEFYRRLPGSTVHPTTAVPSVELFRQTYQQLAQEGADAILSLHIAPALSATVDVAESAARQVDAVPVTVINSMQLSLGLGFLVIAAAQAARDGQSVEEIIALVEEQITRTHVFAALDTLEYLRRSGRMNRAVAGFGNLLQVKPLLRMYNGDPTAERVRTNNGAMKRLVKILRDLGPLDQVALVHAHAPERAEHLRQAAKHLLPRGKIESVEITPVLGANIGPGAVGFACVTAQDEIVRMKR